MRTKTCLVTLLLIGPLIRGHAQGIWTQQSDFGGTARTGAVGFAIDGKGYIGTGLGFNEAGYGVTSSSFREYDPSTNTWTRKAHLPGVPGARVTQAVGFSIGSKGYVATGLLGGAIDSLSRRLAEYDPATDTWTEKAHFPGAARYNAVAFSTGNKGYVGLGTDSRINALSDFWEYDPASDAWTRKADFGGGPRYGAVGFSIGNKGYVGTGNFQIFAHKDFWEYDPATDVWKQKADYGGEGVRFAVGFAINGKGYIGLGVDPDQEFLTAFWEYDPTVDTWTQLADFPGAPRSGAVGFAIGNYGYLGTGSYFSPTVFKDFLQFTPP
jgi:N-acetylneuraminic acid mutarotase